MITKLHIALGATFHPVAWKTTSALVPGARAIRDGAGPLASVATGRGLDKKTDTGALKNGQRRALMDKDYQCPEDSVFYFRGEPYLDGEKVTKEEGCDGKCCVGEKACAGMRGCVKKDGSCWGKQACADVLRVDNIRNSCKGDKACHFLGYYHGGVGTVDSSCNAKEACVSLGFFGAIDKVTSSCNADGACSKLGYGAYGGGSGMVDTITNSCNAEGACSKLAFRGQVLTVNSSCNAKEACVEVGSYGTIKSIVGACNSEIHRPCLQVAGSNWEAEIGDITSLKRDWRVKKTRAEDIAACSALCEDSGDDCSGIKWRQGVQKPCRIFKGSFSGGKCHDKDLCITL